MAAVFRNLAGLGARPFEQLTPQQATPADAVKVVLKAQGRSTAPEGVAATRDIALPLPSGPVAGAMKAPGGNLAANVPQRRRDARDPAQCGGSTNPEQNVHGCDP